MVFSKAVSKIVGTISYITSHLGYQFEQIDPEFLRNEQFKMIYSKCKRYTLTSIERMFALYNSVRYVVESEIQGDFVECGVWRGGSAMLIAYLLKDLKFTDKRIYLYDTYDGMTPPGMVDKQFYDGASAFKDFDRMKKSGQKWNYASLEDVKQNMKKTGYPSENIVFVKGDVKKTIPAIIPNSISILRLDTDWYESTKWELNYLFPYLEEGGVLIIDDYGHWEGSKKAVDEYFHHAGVPVLLNRIDYSGRLVIKQHAVSSENLGMSMSKINEQYDRK